MKINQVLYGLALVKGSINSIKMKKRLNGFLMKQIAQLVGEIMISQPFMRITGRISGSLQDPCFTG